MWLACLAVLANLAVLNYLLSLGGVLGLFRLRDKWLDRKCAPASRRLMEFAGETLPSLLAPPIVLAVMLTPIIRALVDKKAFYYGGADGFWADTMTSLAMASLYGQSFSKPGAVILCCVAAVCVAMAVAVTALRFSREGLSESVSRRIAAVGILLLCVAGVIVQHQVMGDFQPSYRLNQRIAIQDDVRPGL